MELYCVKCKAKRQSLDVQHITTKNGVPALVGKCSVCGTKQMQFEKGRSRGKQEVV